MADFLAAVSAGALVADPNTSIQDTMTTDAASQYEMVNSFMRLFGEAEIEQPSTGSAKEKMDYLISTYTTRLRAKEPRLSALPDELLPDALLVSLRQSYREMFSSAKPHQENA